MVTNSSEQQFLVSFGQKSKKLFGSSLASLTMKAESAFGVAIDRFTVSEAVMDGGQKNIIDVDVDSDEELRAIAPNQLIRAHAKVISPTLAASQGRVTSGIVDAHKHPLISLSKFEYASGKSYDNWFFDGYSHTGVHATMLKDRYRSGAYLHAMTRHKHLIEGKVVVDVGSGSGIWALHAARLGARRVYAIEAGGMADLAKQHIRDNGFADVVEVIHSTGEDFIAAGAKDPKTGARIEADMIVSEWMGYWLLSENVLSSVLRVRDAVLRHGGIVFPSHCQMFLGLFEDVVWTDYWKDVHGINMDDATGLLGERDFNRIHPSVEDIPDSCLNSENALVRWVDCVRDSVDSVRSFSSKFKATALRTTTLHGFLGYFSVYFHPEAASRVLTYEEVAAAAAAEEIVELRTWPSFTKTRNTHWHQEVLLIPPVPIQAGTEVTHRNFSPRTRQFDLKWDENKDEPRYFDANITWRVGDQPPQTKCWEKA